MAPTVREVLSDRGASEPATVTTAAQTTTAGDTLIIYTGYDFYVIGDMNDPTITGETVIDTQVVADAGTNGPHMKLYTCSLIGGGAKTINFSADTDADATVLAYVLAGACEIDGTAGTGQSLAPTTAHTIAAAAPATSDSLLLASVLRQFGGLEEHYTGAPSGMTGFHELLHPFGCHASAQQVLTASGSTGSRTFTNPNNRAYAGIQLAVKASGTIAGIIGRAAAPPAPQGGVVAATNRSLLGAVT